MKFIFSAGLMTLLMITTLQANAQESETDTIYAYGTYFKCSPGAESLADEIIRSSYKPHYDQAVEQGRIVSWSWLQHYMGGQWRRVLVLVTNELEAALETSGALGEIISDTSPAAGRAFSEICDSHEDYLWEAVPGIGGGPAAAQRGVATFSTYIQCDLAREERADELFRDEFQAVYDKYVGDGQLASWNWFRQTVGGSHRRLLNMGADDHNTLLTARAAILQELEGRKYQRALREFREICHTTTDYMWDTAMETS